MKSKILKITIAMLLIMTLTMTNFVFVGSSLISYATSSTETNHQNVEFSSYFENSNGKTGTTLDKLLSSSEEIYLHLQIGVKKEGYFNGEIKLENANFNLKETESPYVSSIKDNTIALNQINAGGTADIKIKIEPIKEESFNIGLLSNASKLSISGIYRDSTEKDIKIKGEREVTLNLIQNNSEENIQNELKIITNKLVKIEGEEKRLVQFSWNMGLKENNYPIKQINAEITIPEIEENQAEVEVQTYLNNMTSASYEYKDSKVELTMKNEENEEGKVNWKTAGSENAVITCIYDKDVDLSKTQIEVEEKVTLYDSREITSKNIISLDNEERDGIIEITSKNMEESIYKGKLHSGIDRTYASKTTLRINCAKVPEYISIKENQAKFAVEENEEVANVYYNKTFIKKEQFDKLFGENGSLTIYNEKGEEIAIINNSTTANEDGNIVISYEEKETKSIEIKTTNPITEGELEISHIKTIKASDKSTVEQASKLTTKIASEYNMNNNAEYSKGIVKEINSNIQLENTKTEARIEVNKETLSTVVTNNIEIKAILKSNNEQYDLYKNPQIVIEMPSQVESIKINSVDIIYENELKVKNCEVDGRNIKISLEGEQTQYKETAVEGAIVVINADVIVNKKSATEDEQIRMAYNNQNMYTNGISSGIATSQIRIVAPKDITAINNIKELNVETIGQEETKQVMVARGQEAKQVEGQIEIINNNENAIENVKVLGDLPTDSKSNNMEIEMVKEIEVQGAENAKIYYSENEEATDDLENAKNGWEENAENIINAKKYLIVIDEVAARSSVQGTYEMTIPENLEYNQNATTTYEVNYTNSQTQLESTIKATQISLQTGVGPKAETKMEAEVSGREISGTVKNGEVIKYKIEVSNDGSEDISNLKVAADVPEGTTMVEPEKYYEYTGASYYKELDTKTYESTIDTLKVGETVYKEFEVRVNKDTVAGTKITNMAEITYGDVKKQSNQTEFTTETGNLMVSVKRTTDRNVDLYEFGTVKYIAIIENISNQKQDNVTVKTNITDNLTVESLELITGMKKVEVNDNSMYEVGSLEETTSEKREVTEEELTQNTSTSSSKSEILEYKEKVNIGTLQPGEIKVLSYGITINKSSPDKINFSIVVTDEQKEYKSNNWEEKVNEFKIYMDMKSNTGSEYVKAGDTIEYTITVQNESTSEAPSLEIKDFIPEQLSINKVTVDGQEVDAFTENDVVVTDTIPANNMKTIKVETVVDYSEGRDEPEAITNVAYVEVLGEKLATTSEVSHIIEANEEKQEAPNTSETPETPNNTSEESNKTENGDIAEGTKTIAGHAWYDENANGKKDVNEKTISNVKVRLLNTKTNNLVKDSNGNLLEATTNENGIYILSKIEEGTYIVIFDYNNTEYALTKYKVEGATESENSNAMINELTINNEKAKVASTDIIEVQENNISNINIGLIKLQNFDLKLDKYVSRILIQDASGTTVKEYNNSTIAKAELDAKKVNGSTVIVEYSIVVTNNGEVEGYAKKIVDYMPNSLKFSSELNKDWYQSGEALYNTSLANEKIAVGETKTLKLTLTKSMTEDNTGLINNRAEIAEAYNELGIADSNSTPGNNQKGENDMGEADVILSIRTGGAVYITIAIIIVIALGVTSVILIKRKKSNESNK